MRLLNTLSDALIDDTVDSHSTSSPPAAYCPVLFTSSTSYPLPVGVMLNGRRSFVMCVSMLDGVAP